jgi:hypothetical protein
MCSDSGPTRSNTGTSTSRGPTPKDGASPCPTSETSVYRLVNDPDGGGLSYDLDGPSGTSAVTVEGGRIEFVLPLYQEPTVVFEGDRLTASVEGEFIDNWERVD